ncbi:MAG: carboxymuconolactone decarboxylase family protein, partial [Bacteroidota bacterium]
RKHSGFSPVEQEVILLSIAYVNGCEYCVSAHSFVADMMSKVPTEVTDAIRNGALIPDEKLSTLSKTTKLLTENRGHLSDAELAAFLGVGYTESHVLGIITGIAAKTMSNYSNHNTHPEVDEAFRGRLWKKNG